jgi:hypothetical protein
MSSGRPIAEADERDQQAFLIRRHPQYQMIEVAPNCPDLDRALQARGFAAADHPVHGYVLRRVRQSLLSPSLAFANAGLALVAHYLLMHAGHAAELRVPSIHHVCPPTTLDNDRIGVANPLAMQFIHLQANGLIRHSLGTDDLATLCGEICLAFTAARVAFQVATEAGGEQLAEGLRRQGICVTLAFSDRCSNPGQRVTVATSHGLGHHSVISEPVDLLICTEAAQAVGERIQIVLLSYGRSRLFGLLSNNLKIPPSVADRIMAAFGPEEISVPRLGFTGRQVEVIWSTVRGGPGLAGSLTGSELYERGVAQNPTRNRRIARIAMAVAESDEAKLRQLRMSVACPRSGPSACVVVVRTVGHALRLAERLPTWSIVTTPHVHHVGLDAPQTSLLASRRHAFPDLSRAIITVPALATLDLHAVDVLIRAAGGTDLPDLSAETLLCRAPGDRRLLVIDFDDRQHAELRRASRRRREAYLVVGWFSAGMLPVIGRIRRFLAERPEGEP